MILAPEEERACRLDVKRITLHQLGQDHLGFLSHEALEDAEPFRPQLALLVPRWLGHQDTRIVVLHGPDDIGPERIGRLV